MKNVKKLLIFVAISTFVFASWDRTSVLGGAGYWADDYSNVYAFPASVNDHNVSFTNGENFTTIFDKDGTAWGFAGGTGDDVANIMWGNGNMGVTFGLAMTPEIAAEDDTMNCGEGEDETCVREASNVINLGVGMPLAVGDFGFTYNTDGGGTMGVNLRRAQSVWMWDNMLVSFSNTSDDGDTDNDESAMDLDVGLYTNTDHGNGTSTLFGAEFNYGTSTPPGSTESDDMMGLTWNFAVESAMTDWATLRVGYSHAYDLQEGGAGDTFSAGLGFNYGSFNLDMTLSSLDKMMMDPVKYVAGRNADGVGNTLGSTWTISYNW